MQKLRISTEVVGPHKDIVKIKVSGFLDAHTVPEMEEVVQSLIEKGLYKMIVDLEELSYISSAGLGVFMSVIGDIRDNRGDIILIRIPPKIFKVFDLLGFTEIFTTLNQEEEAILAFTKE
ncbi:MAG TPA: STAS domain-containing protein [Candidatus Limnocylindrales bacterium]|jgi:anti-sigma B factor antagonist|nr:STAS domain-containing protein [Candidatus Limnocylindrales bacterium]